MTLGTPFVANAPTLVSGGDTEETTNATVQAANAGATVTPTATFAFVYNGSTLNFINGVTAVVTPDLLAALTAAGSPFGTP
jgi:hypothetical protein